MDLALVGKARVAFWVDRPFIAPLSLNIIGSANYGVGGLEVGGIYNYSYGSVRGIQVAGITNLVDKDFVGVEVGGIANIVDGTMGGIQATFGVAGAGTCIGVCVAGLVHFVKKDVDGIQISALVSRADGDLNGMQVGLWNVALGGDSLGLQIGLVNSAHSFTLITSMTAAGTTYDGKTKYNMTTETTANGSHEAKLTGMQVGFWSSAYNVAGAQIGVFAQTDQSVSGLQVSASFNMNQSKDHHHETKGIAIGGMGQFSEKVAGLEIGSLFNYATEVVGVQIGVVNVTGKLEGIQIGAVNVATKGPIPVLPGLNVGW